MTEPLLLTFACGGYDRMEAMRRGIVQPAGIDLKFIQIDLPRIIFDRMAGRQEFDLSELSCSEFIAQTGRGDRNFVALPVFPSKVFRHGFIYYNKKSGIRTAKDLEGKRIGTPLYTQTAAVFIRGLLMEEYGVDLSGVQWVQGAVEKAGAHGIPSAPPLLKPVKIEQNHTDKSLGDLLAEGKIDALLGSRAPETFGKHPDVARLFPNYREVERDYYKRTRIHPIMHCVAIRRDTYEKNPWIAKPLYEAFQASKAWALERMRFSAAQMVMLPWLFPDLDEIDELFGGDPWPYGVEANRPTLEALVRYMVAQNMIAKPIPVDELFLKV
jgi:4,5-dihydroxyphthalate decarboxylase